jgi:hypothetical protein
VGNVRVSSSNTLGITFINIPAGGGNITPTASQSYTVVALRGMGTYSLSATLSPASVAANTTAEQCFTVTGIRAGDLIQVNKPTPGGPRHRGRACRRQQQRLHHVPEHDRLARSPRPPRSRTPSSGFRASMR